jgi:hypothetical protein
MAPLIRNSPARAAALKAGARRFKCEVSCPHGHFWRFTDSMGCAECSDERRAARISKSKSVKKIVGTRRGDDDKPPAIGQDIDNDQNLRRLKKASQNFLKLLYAEKLEAIRSGVSCD